MSTKGLIDDGYYVPLVATNPGLNQDEVAEAAANKDAELNGQNTPVHHRKDFPIILLITFVLSVNAGMINAITILATSGAGYPPFTSSHHTGTTTRLGIHLARLYDTGSPNNIAEAVNWATLMICFALGAATSGFFIRDTSFNGSRKYGILLVVEGIFLILTAFVTAAFLDNRDDFAECSNQRNDMLCFGAPQQDLPACDTYRLRAVLLASLGSYACGIQNSLCTRMTGAVIRTTHTTGLLTDLGLLIGQSVRWFTCPFEGEREPEFWRYKIWWLIFIGFVFGCTLGTYGYDTGINAWRAHMIDFTAGSMLIFGVVYTIKRLDMRYRRNVF